MATTLVSVSITLALRFIANATLPPDLLIDLYARTWTARSTSFSRVSGITNCCSARHHLGVVPKARRPQIRWVACTSSLLHAGPSSAHHSGRRQLDYGRSTTFTVSLEGITETEAAGILQLAAEQNRFRYTSCHLLSPPAIGVDVIDFSK
jgi:hypothetical protein